MSAHEYYHKVFVALISWTHHDITLDENAPWTEMRNNYDALKYDLDTELRNVERICGDEYGFDVTRIRIPNVTREAPPGYESYGDWLSAELHSFYERLDQEAEVPSLVIVWYGGHGGVTGFKADSLAWWSGFFATS